MASWYDYLQSLLLSHWQILCIYIKLIYQNNDQIYSNIYLLQQACKCMLTGPNNLPAISCITIRDVQLYGSYVSLMLDHARL